MNRRITVEQVLQMTNKEQRHAFLKTWQEWPLLVEARELDMQVREIVFPDGSRFTATLFGEYPRMKQLGLHKHLRGYMPYETADGHLVGHLTRLRKEFAALPHEEITARFAQEDGQSAADTPVVLGTEQRTLSKEEIMALKNTQQREDFIRACEEWPVFVEVPVLGMTVRKIGLPDGFGIYATTYGDSYSTHYRLLGEFQAYTSQNEFTGRINDHLRKMGAIYRSRQPDHSVR